MATIDGVLIWSENWRELADWYRDTFELEVLKELSLPDDMGVTFKMGDVLLWVGYHDQVHGLSKDPFRIMIEFGVDSVTATYEKLKAQGVEFLTEPKVSPTGDYMVATAKDPEGNILQLTGDVE